MSEPRLNARSTPRGRPFAKGNPGRPAGSRNKASLAVDALMEGEAEALGRKAVELAMAGDTTALKLCLERVAPPRKGRPVAFNLPKVATVADLFAAQVATVEAMAAGVLSPDEALDVARILEAVGASIERREIEERLRRLEAGQQEQTQ